jgi:hypothetical protein
VGLEGLYNILDICERLVALPLRVRGSLSRGVEPQRGAALSGRPAGARRTGPTPRARREARAAAGRVRGGSRGDATDSTAND